MTRKAFLASLVALPLLPKLLRASPQIVVPQPKVPYSPAIRWGPTAIPLGPIDYDALLWAIAQRETGDNERVRGPAGERSRYGIKEIVWRQHMHNAPFSICSGVCAWVVADEHLAWLAKNLIFVSPWYLAYAWNAGLSAANACPPFNGKAHEYAYAVEALYYDRLNPNRL